MDQNKEVGPPYYCESGYCLTRLLFIGTINLGDEEGRGYEALYQCPNCKMVVVK